MTTYLKDLSPGDKVRGVVHECPNCRQWFIARADAKFCGNTCRMAFVRKQESET